MCNIFGKLGVQGPHGPKYNGLRCQTCKYTNTKTNTTTQIHQVGLNTLGPQYTLGMAPLKSVGGKERMSHAVRGHALWGHIFVETCDIWDTDYNFYTYKPEFMIIFVNWAAFSIIAMFVFPCLTLGNNGSTYRVQEVQETLYPSKVSESLKNYDCLCDTWDIDLVDSEVLGRFSNCGLQLVTNGSFLLSASPSFSSSHLGIDL